MFVTPPIDPVELEALKLLHFSLPPVALRSLSLLIHLLSSVLFAGLVSKLIKKDKLVWSIGFFIFFFSPWASFLSTFYLIQNILLLVLVTLARFKKIIPIAFLAILTIFLLNKFYGKDYSFLKTLAPANLGLEINESQRINYLSVVRAFILPYPVRVFTYNKPELGLNKIVTQFIAFFDFEQLAAPDKTYEITKLSGLSPKGTLELFYIWEIPILILGLQLLQKSDLDKKYLGKIFLIAIIPFLFFEKKLLAQTAFLTIVPLLVIETLAVFTLLKKVNKAFMFIGVVIAAIFVINFYNVLFFKPLTYQTPGPYLFREIAIWLSKNYASGKNYIVTTRFGSTETLVRYYLGQGYNNITFRSFDLGREPPSQNTVYIGLAGEFVKPGKNLEAKDPPGGIKILDKIKGEDEPVFEYGSNIWIGLSQ